MLSYNHHPLLQAAAPFTPSGNPMNHASRPFTMPPTSSSSGVSPISPQAAAAAMIFRHNAERLFPAYYMQNPSTGPFDYAGAAGINLFNAYGLVQEEPKPNHSYIGLIALAILSHPEKKLVLSDIYQYILDNYTYFRARGPGWRNSIRHNLSLNDCFIKAGRSANGKGHYWAIHPACSDDFAKGDFRRRHAQRKVRKAMGLSVPDDDSDGARTPSPKREPVDLSFSSGKVSPPTTPCLKRSFDEVEIAESLHHHISDNSPIKCDLYQLSPPVKKSRKRNFSIASLLLPDKEEHENDGCEHY